MSKSNFKKEGRRNAGCWARPKGKAQKRLATKAGRVSAKRGIHS